MVTGKVISFDEFRGFGFIAPDRGGEDVFMHVNDLDSDKRLIALDARVEFTVENGGKGLKASHVRVLDPPAARTPAPSVPAPATTAPNVPPGPAGSASDGQTYDTGFCDVLTTEEFTQEVTEALLGSVPTLTAEQILGVRKCLIEYAQAHGWIDG